MMDAFTEDEKVSYPISLWFPPCRLATDFNMTTQRFVLAEYIKASQVGTEQLVEFISEPPAPN